MAVSRNRGLLYKTPHLSPDIKRVSPLSGRLVGSSAFLKTFFLPVSCTDPGHFLGLY